MEEKGTVVVVGGFFHKKFEEVEFWREITFWLAFHEITYSNQNKLEKTKHYYYYYLMALSKSQYFLFFFLILSCGFIKEA